MNYFFVLLIRLFTQSAVEVITLTHETSNRHLFHGLITRLDLTEPELTQRKQETPKKNTVEKKKGKKEKKNQCQFFYSLKCGFGALVRWW